MIEVILSLALLTLMVGVIARNMASINDIYKEGQLVRDINALNEAVQNYYAAQGAFPNYISELSSYLPANWTNKSPFGDEYELSVNSSVARIETPIPDTINITYLPNTYTYTRPTKVRYVRSDIIIPQQNFSARWERKYIYETAQGAPQ